MHLVAVWAVDLSVLATVDLCAVQRSAADQAAEAASAEERDTLLSLLSTLSPVEEAARGCHLLRRVHSTATPADNR